MSVDEGSREVYVMVREDGRVCVGGARAVEQGAAEGSSDDSSLSPAAGAYLRGFLSLFPSLGFEEGRVESEWKGVLGFTPDAHPICGPLPARPGVFVAAGFNGQGSEQLSP